MITTGVPLLLVDGYALPVNVRLPTAKMLLGWMRRRASAPDQPSPRRVTGRDLSRARQDTHIDVIHG